MEIEHNMERRLNLYKQVDEKLFNFLFKLLREVLIRYIKHEKCTHEYLDKLFGFTFDKTTQLSVSHLIYLILRNRRLHVNLLDL